MLYNYRYTHLTSLSFREILFKAGDYYSPEIVDKSKRRLRETGIYSMVNLVPIKVTDSDSLVNIVISLNKFFI